MTTTTLTEAEVINQIELGGYNSRINLVNLFPNSLKVALAYLKHTSSLFALSDEFKNNKEIVMLALNKDGRNLQYANERFRIDRLFVLNIAHICPLKYLYDSFQDDEEIVRISIRAHHYCQLEYISPRLLQDSAIIDLAVLKNFWSFVVAPEYYRNDINNARRMFAIDGHLIKSTIFVDNAEIAYIAVSTEISVIKDLSKRLKNDLDFIWSLSAVSTFADLPLSKLGSAVRDNLELMAHIISVINSSTTLSISSRLLTNVKICHLIISSNVFNLYHIPNAFIPRGYGIASILVVMRLGE